MTSEISAFLAAVRKPLIVVLGPTASGKTGYSIALALALREQGIAVEVVNADSRQLYRHLDIGTAKITADEMRGIPHHLLDVLDPKEEATAAWYKEQATAMIDTMHERGGVPMLVGGSMLYISAVIDDLAFVAAAAPELRKRLEEAYDRDRGAALYAKLREIDPETAAGFSPNNRPYLVRAMEIFEGTGIKPSQAKPKSSCPYDLFVIGIHRERADLHRRIHERVRAMFAAGWIDEVRGLLEKGYTSQDPGMKSHGYREIDSALKSGEDPLVTLGSSKGDIASKTRQYAKRQMTWWKGDPRIRWITPPASPA